MDRLLEALHADKPLRVWSLIVTIFGDVVMRQGRDVAPGPIWTGHLLDLLERLGVEGGLVRTSLSRLVSSGVLDRDKAGRNTFYRLAPSSAAAFAEAAESIYCRRKRHASGHFHLAVLDRAEDRGEARQRLEAQGFRFLSSNVGLKPDHQGGRAPDLPAGVIIARASAQDEVKAAARHLWRIDDLQRSYRESLALLGSLDEAGDPDAAILARIILVHRMRRIILRDPVLPASALPPDWAGDAARALFAQQLARLEGPSEAWLAMRGFRSGETH